MQTQRLIVIGDSHAAFWRGRNAVFVKEDVFAGVDVEHLGPATAHNLFSEQEQSKYVKLLCQRMERRTSPYGAAVLCFGEIDCRAHLVRIALKNNTSLSEAVNVTVERYMMFVDWFVDYFGIPVVIWGPGPTTPPAKFSFNPNYPAIGTTVERNYAAFCFNQACMRESKSRPHVEHATILQHLINFEGITNTNALYDGCHVDISSMELAITELSGALTRLGVPELTCNLRKRWLISQEPFLRNVAERLIAEPATKLDNYAPRNLTNIPDGQACFRTRADLKPRARIDLRAGFLVQSIEIYGLRDKLNDARSLSVETGLDPSCLDVVYKPTPESWHPLPDGSPLVITIDPALWPVRFVQLYLQEASCFELDTIRVMARSFDETLSLCEGIRS
jgi:hypothetical protein